MTKENGVNEMIVIVINNASDFNSRSFYVSERHGAKIAEIIELLSDVITNKTFNDFINILIKTKILVDKDSKFPEVITCNFEERSYHM